MNTILDDVDRICAESRKRDREADRERLRVENLVNQLWIDTIERWDALFTDDHSFREQVVGIAQRTKRTNAERQFWSNLESVKREIEHSRPTAPALRDRTYHDSFAWYHLPPNLWELREIRHDTRNSTHEIVVGCLITNSSDELEWLALCAHCGTEFSLGERVAQYTIVDGVPSGPFCCSRECADELDIDCGITCTSCGVDKTEKLDCDGNPSCSLCG